MRTSQYFLFTLKEFPSDTKMMSHQLMLRAGMIRKLSSGIYTWLPTGQRVLHKIEDIIRKEMNKIGALEISLPMVHPSYLWKESGRLTEYGPELLKFTNNSKREFVLGPTNEEVITDLIRNEIKSYKQLPINFYQIQRKFRDEIRPRFGVIRSCEFIMKDAYSFHNSKESLELTYNEMYETYNIFFTKIGLNVRIVEADSGSIGGTISHEFQAILNYNENYENYNFEKSKNLKLDKYIKENSQILFHNNMITSTSIISNEPKEIMQLIETPKTYSLNELVKYFNIPIQKFVKTFVVFASKNSINPLIALMIRADHNLNKIKAESLPQVAVPLTFASEEEIRIKIGVGSDSLGPVNLPLPLIIDRNVALMSNFIAGANVESKYFCGINWYRDIQLPEVADLRKVINVNVNIQSDRNIKLKSNNDIEVGHIFQLGKKYSKVMKAIVKSKNGKNKTIFMGCYGIGITRTIAAIIEQHHDKYGIVWPEILAPFRIAILPINLYKSSNVRKFTETLYHQLCSYGMDVLLDDREERQGVIFADIDLIGIPHIIVIGEKNINLGKIEYKNRSTGKKQIININNIIDFLNQI